MALSKSPVLEEFEKALGEMVSMQPSCRRDGTVVTLLSCSAMPEPVTKFIAAWATVGAHSLVGAKTLYNLVTGWFQLMEEVKVPLSRNSARRASKVRRCSHVRRRKHSP
jgi:hypothetical protein